MTYCLGIVTRTGLVMAADSRTNAGVDYISSYPKMFDFSVPGDRVVTLCTSGNLSATQAVITLLKRDISTHTEPNLHTLTSFYDIARYIGEKLRKVQEQDRPWLEKDGVDFHCSILAGGQLPAEDHTLYQIYSQGNFIQVSRQTPFLQIGETKYGKPILDRILTYQTPISAAAKCALLSIDSTMKSNLSVGPPISLIMYERDSYRLGYELQLSAGTPYLSQIRRLWEISLTEAFNRMPDINWSHYQEQPHEPGLFDALED
jgi:putative proteasome-type protease